MTASGIDCPCGNDCFADLSEEDRRFAEGTIHWKQAAIVRDAEKIGGIFYARMRRGIGASRERMHSAQVSFIERILGRRIE